MCGIVGRLSLARALDPGALDAALLEMRRRGPDGRGVWFSEDRRCGLGHTRLAINDVEGGAQPFSWGEGGRYVGVINGELYGHPELRFSNVDAHDAANPRSDCWVLAGLWERHGFPEVLEHLRGEFAFLVYDTREQALYVARDRFGIKPLCWAVMPDGTLGFASKPSALWTLGLAPGWSADGFWHASATQYPPLGGNLFDEVREVAPATWMRFDSEGAREGGVYWRVPDGPSWDGSPLNSERVTSSTDLFGRALDEAIGLRVRPEAGTAVQLSGGIDSAAVLALAQRHAPGQVHAFSVDFAGEGHATYSEGDLAREVVALCGVAAHTVLALGAEDLLAGLRDAVGALGGLFVNGHGVAKHHLSRAIRERGLKVVLSGEGADELLYGYRHFLPHLPGGVAADPLEDPAGLGILTSRGTSRHGLDEVERALGFLPDIWVSKWALGQRIGSLLDPQFVGAYRERDAFMETLSTLDLDRSRPPWEVARQLWLSTALRSYLLEVLGDGSEMAHSVEGRPPFLDHRLWETVAELPLSLVTGAPGKAILRESLRGLVPESIRTRPKHPFMAPPLSTPLLDTLRDTVRDHDHPFVDRSAALARLESLRDLRGPAAWEWEPALLWLLSSYHLQSSWTWGE